eukprot:TRINITY_DN10103_c0_g1_i1.p1 TRINITY_DN10103_c0_g1~~TRINITY_DN10103_c0_g1_i1.p1  ORF type:complete len:441 (+),score=91.86 TRINITY_DN10103_c0_g1_i1:88-1323(+)
MIQVLMNKLNTQKEWQTMSDDSTGDEIESLSSISTMASPSHAEQNDAGEGGDMLREDVQHDSQRSLSKASTATSTADMGRDRIQTIEKLKVKKSVSSQFAEIRRAGSGDFKELKQTISFHAADLERKQSQEHAAKLEKISAEHNETKRLHRGAEQEANALKIKLTSAESQAKLLQARLDESQKDRSNNEKDRRSMRQQMEEVWQRIIAAEGELCKYDVEKISQAAEVERLTAARREVKEATQAIKKERDVAQSREEELRREHDDLFQQLSDAKRERDVAPVKLEADKREVIAKLERQIDRMTMKARARKEEIAQLEQSKVFLQKQLQHVQIVTEEDLNQLTDEISMVKKDLKTCHAKKAELSKMIEDMRIKCRSQVFQPATPRTLRTPRTELTPRTPRTQLTPRTPRTVPE